jgi:hypothetical protein
MTATSWARQVEKVVASFEEDGLKREKAIREEMEKDFAQRLQQERARWLEFAENEVRAGVWIVLRLVVADSASARGRL